jgi:hypothetical protein
MSHLILRNSKETRLDGEVLVKSPGKLIGEAYNPCSMKGSQKHNIRSEYAGEGSIGFNVMHFTR